jgi:predicted nuclease of restriction endonuclease-like (RecB) superfamily
MNFNELINSLRELDGSLQRQAVQAANVGLTLRNWFVGAYIVEFEQNGEDRADYGENIISEISKKLKIRGLPPTTLRLCRTLYQEYPEIRQTPSVEFLNSFKNKDSQIQQTVSVELTSFFSQISQTASGKFNPEILQTSAKSSRPDFAPAIDTLFQKLSFSHFVELLRINDSVQRAFYEIECIKAGWSVRELKRQIGSLLFERLGLSTDKEKLLRLTSEETTPAQPTDIIKDPYIFEFLGLTPKEAFREDDLETALLDHLQDFLLELGVGFCFEDRQKKIRIGSRDYFIDLVFYHRKLHCHVLVELKVEPFTHGNAGQLNTYLNYYRKHEMAEGDNPPVGLLLCTDKDHALVEYALGGMDENLFVSSYKVALPNREELEAFLRKEIDSSKP